MTFSFSNIQSQADQTPFYPQKAASEVVALTALTEVPLQMGNAYVDNDLPDLTPSSSLAPFLLTRDELFSKCPMLTEMLDEARKDDNAVSVDLDVIGLLAPYESMRLLLPEQKFSVSSVLVLFVPDMLEQFLLEAISKPPRMNNKLTIDLQYSCFYLSWQFGLSHEILVSEDTLTSHMFHNFEYTQVPDSSKDVFTYVVVVAGNSAAVGGFKVDKNFMDDAQAQSYAAINYKSYVHFEEETLAEAALKAERIGPHPWYDGWHDCKTSVGKFIAPWVQDFTREMYSNDLKRHRAEQLGLESTEH